MPCCGGVSCEDGVEVCYGDGGGMHFLTFASPPRASLLLQCVVPRDWPASLSLPRGQCQVSRRSELTVARRSQSHLRKDWRLVHKDTAIRQLILVFFISSSSRNLLRNRTGKFFKLVPRRRPFPRPPRDIFGNIINLSCDASPSSSSGRSLESSPRYVPVQCIVCPKEE